MSLSGPHLLDINECTRNTSNCHENATCHNTDGLYNCTCKDGYQGNGTHCAGNASILIQVCAKNVNQKESIYR